MLTSAHKSDKRRLASFGRNDPLRKLSTAGAAKISTLRSRRTTTTEEMNSEGVKKIAHKKRFSVAL